MGQVAISVVENNYNMMVIRSEGRRVRIYFIVHREALFIRDT